VSSGCVAGPIGFTRSPGTRRKRLGMEGSAQSTFDKMPEPIGPATHLFFQSQLNAIRAVLWKVVGTFHVP
jgi:hypothetical protein